LGIIVLTKEIVMNRPHKYIDKIRSIFYRYILHHFGFGCRVSPETWEQQFAEGEWRYLEGDDEKEHYEIIVNFYQKFSDFGSVLDIGCGQGILFKKFKENLSFVATDYTGIDISKCATEQAVKRHPEAIFLELDFDKNPIEQRFDVIVFNESLYYFKKPSKILKRCIRENLNDNGFLIISMCDYKGHDRIWTAIDKRFTILKAQETMNSKGQKWLIKVAQPK
jgi:SAM-dependent methyltransferase